MSEKEPKTPVDYRIAAEALAKTAALVAGNPFDESSVETFKRMTQEEARRYFEVLSTSAAVIAGNS